jgi:hypothetical protein
MVNSRIGSENIFWIRIVIISIIKIRKNRMEPEINRSFLNNLRLDIMKIHNPEINEKTEADKIIMISLVFTDWYLKEKNFIHYRI